MSEIKIIGNDIQNLPLKQLNKQDKSSTSFDLVITEAMEMLSKAQNNADTAIKELASGGDITHAMLLMEKADMSFQLMLEVRNRLLNAYDEVMRMQV
ncbi:MAG: flagellar hook-basal body complex protein FliE [Thermodesulfovibrionales bacterium]|nr:flagellar hook-basal body complex protein FliE [Thermodesulfovibrionales bacterium]